MTALLKSYININIYKYINIKSCLKERISQIIAFTVLKKKKKSDVVIVLATVYLL